MQIFYSKGVVTFFYLDAKIRAATSWYFWGDKMIVTSCCT